MDFEDRMRRASARGIQKGAAVGSALQSVSNIAGEGIEAGGRLLSAVTEGGMRALYPLALIMALLPPTIGYAGGRLSGMAFDPRKGDFSAVKKHQLLRLYRTLTADAEQKARQMLGAPD
jgi:hypothetical protein